MPSLPPKPGAAATLRHSARPCTRAQSSDDGRVPELLSTGQLTLRVAIIVAVVEALIMVLLPLILPPAWAVNSWLGTAADVVLLTVISVPLMRFWVAQPFVDARNVAIAQAQALASTDALTRLANRRHLIEALSAFIEGLSIPRPGLAPGALLLLDLDGFKPVNDRYGHEAGDRVLITMAQRLQSLSRDSDLPARLGGDEFVLLLKRLNPDPQTALNEARTIAQTVSDLLAAPIEYGEHTLHVGVSIGVRMISSHMDCDSALRDADQALYLAKHAGKGRVVFFDADAHKKTAPGVNRERFF